LAKPRARVTLIGLPWAHAFAGRFGRYFDSFLAFPPQPGLHEAPHEPGSLGAFLNEARDLHLDLGLQLHGSGRLTNSVVQALGAVETAGYYPREGPKPGCGAYFPYPENGTEVQRNLDLARLLGYPGAGASLEFPLLPEDQSSLAGVVAGAGIELHDYVCIHPGARLASRRWPAERFAVVADALAGQGLQVIITGSQSEAPIAGRVAELMRSPATDLSGATTLGAMGALLAGARLVVTNDTGTSHIAAALRTPSVVIASGSDVARWAPEDRRLHRVLARDIECRPCSHEVCPIGHPCALAIEVDDVLRQARELLLLSEVVRP
jgi:ADP-heptose:LPS heptosyltransferase